jgi:hypothetical protein
MLCGFGSFIMTTRTRLLAVASVSGLLFWVVGCSSDSHLSGSDDPTTRALSDPMNYSPNDQDPNISGGNLSHFDSDAFKKDMDYVLNP